MYSNAHSAIRADPMKKPPAKDKSKIAKKRWNAKKYTLEERKERIANTKAEFIANLNRGQVEA
jgi:hypothetical protein